ncbi:MAG: helix-turn-helix transcriptional regulator [Alkalispirochaeta sp.]
MLNDFVIWMRMVSFTSLFVAVVLAFLSYQQRPFKWLLSYVLFLGAQAAFDLVYTYTLIRRLYLVESAAGEIAATSGLIYLMIDAIATCVVLYFAPRFVLHAVSSPSRRRLRLILGLALGITIAATAVTGISSTVAWRRAVAGIVYLYLGGWFVWGFRHRRTLVEGPWHRWILLFFVVATVWHLSVAVEAALLPVYLPTTPSIPLVALSSAVFNVFWAIVVAVPVLGQFRPGGVVGKGARGQLPEAFIREYDLTRREAQIAGHICRGDSSRQIAEELCISPRTVDTHIQNLYRKCDLGRRVELIALVQRYS